MFELKAPGAAKSRFLTWGQLEQGYRDGSIQPAWSVRDLAAGRDTLVGTLMTAATPQGPAPVPRVAGPAPRGPAVAAPARGPQRPAAQGQQPGLAGMPAAGILDRMPKAERDFRGNLTPYKGVAIDCLGDRVKEVAEASLADWLKTMPSPPPQVTVYRLEQDRVAIRVVQRRPDGLRMLVLCDVEWSRYQNGMQIVFRADWRYLAVWRVVRQLFWLPPHVPYRESHGPLSFEQCIRTWAGTSGLAAVAIWFMWFMGLAMRRARYQISVYEIVVKTITTPETMLFVAAFAISVAAIVIGLIDYWGKLTPDCEAKLERWMHNAIEQQKLKLETTYRLLGKVKILNLPHP